MSPTTRQTQRKWTDLWFAVDAMLPGDPALRWHVEKRDYRSLSVMTSNRCRRQGFRVKTFYDSGTIWIVRLPDKESTESADPGPRWLVPA